MGVPGATRRLSAGLIGLMLMLSPTASAAASAVPPLQVSLDGTTFSPGTELPVLTEIGRVVPGDSETQQVWLRNDMDEPGLVRIDVVNAQATDVDLARTTALAFRDESGTEIGGMTLEHAVDAGQCAMAVNDLVLAPGETQRVDIALSVDPQLGSRPADDGRDGVLQSVGFQLRATLSDQAAGPIGADQCPRIGSTASDSADLPATGGQINIALVVGAAGVVVVGLVVMLVARKRRDRE